jgi:beta-N-acetylhexosaminidase
MESTARPRRRRSRARGRNGVFRRRRRTAAALTILLAGLACLRLEVLLGDEAIGPRPDEIERLYLSAVPEDALIGQRLMVRMDGSATSDLVRQARAGVIGGVIVFPPPGQPTDRLSDEIARLQAAARDGKRPLLLVAIDQEGGEVKRLPQGPPERAPAELGAPGDEAAAREAGRRTGRYLARLGINVDLAPVLDVPSSPGSFVAARSFGTDPRVVAANGSAFAEGLEAGGVIPAVKHFPGLGRAIANTDLERSEIDATESALGEDLAPFREAIARGVPMVMVGHAIYRALDPDAPAALSPTLVGDLLRGKLGFEGVAISDDLGAGAVRAAAPEPKAAVEAAAAGIDVLLFASTDDAGPAREALLDAAKRGALRRPALEQSLLRIAELKQRLGGPD